MMDPRGKSLVQPMEQHSSGGTIRANRQHGCIMPEITNPRKTSATMETGEGESVTLTCYRIDLGEEHASPEMNNYSVVLISPDGEFSHHVFSALQPEDVAQALRVPQGTRVILTQMADLQIWDSQEPEVEQTHGAESAA